MLLLCILEILACKFIVNERTRGLLLSFASALTSPHLQGLRLVSRDSDQGLC